MENIVYKTIDGGKWQSISVFLSAFIQYRSIIIRLVILLFQKKLVIEF